MLTKAQLLEIENLKEKDAYFEKTYKERVQKAKKDAKIAKKAARGKVKQQKQKPVKKGYTTGY